MSEPEKKASETEEKPARKRESVLQLSIKDKNALYTAYMSFVQGGGLFIPTNKKYQLGDEIFLVLQLMDDTSKVPVSGKVIWITPEGAQGNRVEGVGIQFMGKEGELVRNKIETYLAGALKSDRYTHTM